MRPFNPYIHVFGEGICRDEHIVGAVCKSSETLVELNSPIRIRQKGLLKIINMKDSKKFLCIFFHVLSL